MPQPVQTSSGRKRPFSIPCCIPSLPAPTLSELSPPTDDFEILFNLIRPHRCLQDFDGELPPQLGTHSRRVIHETVSRPSALATNQSETY